MADVGADANAVIAQQVASETAQAVTTEGVATLLAADQSTEASPPASAEVVAYSPPLAAESPVVVESPVAVAVESPVVASEAAAPVVVAAEAEPAVAPMIVVTAADGADSAFSNSYVVSDRKSVTEPVGRGNFRSKSIWAAVCLQLLTVPAFTCFCACRIIRRWRKRGKWRLGFAAETFRRDPSLARIHTW